MTRQPDMRSVRLSSSVWFDAPGRTLLATLIVALPWMVNRTSGAEAATSPNSRFDAATNRTSGFAVNPPRYSQPPAGEVLRNRLQALEWGEQTRGTIAPTMHLVETDHFLVFSAWNTSDDSTLARVCENMYETLRQQFKITQTEPVWIGKCPIYIFWEPGHFRRFSAEVDRVSQSNSSAPHADGYHATRGSFSYIVINGVRNFGTSPAEATRRFYEVLVHEGAHAFLNRFVSSRPIARWVEEGLADFMAATVVPLSEASRKYLEGARYGLRRPSAVTRLFDKKDLSSADYGMAQSLVRYLVQTNANAFVQFIRMMKQGTREPDALASAYGLSRNGLVQNWASFAQGSLLRGAY